MTCLYDVTLSFICVFWLPTPEVWLPSPPDWGPRIPNAGIWLPTPRKLDPMDLCRTSCAGENSMPLKDSHLPRTHTPLSQSLMDRQINVLNSALQRA